MSCESRTRCSGAVGALLLAVVLGALLAPSTATGPATEALGSSWTKPAKSWAAAEKAVSLESNLFPEIARLEEAATGTDEELLQAWSELAALFAKDHAAIASIVQLILAGRIAPSIAANVVTAVGQVALYDDSPAARAALVALLREPPDAQILEATLIATNGLAPGDGAVLDAVLDCVDAHVLDAGGEGGALGAAGLTIASAVREGLPEATLRQASDRMEEIASRAEAEGNPYLRVQMAGNAGRVSDLDLLLASAESDGPIQGEAVEALGSVDAVEAVQHLEQIAATGDEGVRSRAISSLEVSPRSDAAADALVRLAQAFDGASDGGVDAVAALTRVAARSRGGVAEEHLRLLAGAESGASEATRRAAAQSLAEFQQDRAVSDGERLEDFDGSGDSVAVNPDMS